MRGPLLCSLLAALGAGCGADARPSVAAPATPASGARAGASRGPMRCPPRMDAAFARDVLFRHARRYGAPEALAAALPVTLSGTTKIEGQVGRVETTIARDAYRWQLLVAGAVSSDGVDAQGAWRLDVGTGVAQRLVPAEGVDVALDAWLMRREYVNAFEDPTDHVRCEDLGIEGSRVDIEFRRPTLASPTLAFDLESAALLAVAHDQVDGRPISTTFEAWSEIDHGVRWPERRTEHPAGAGVTKTELTTVVHGLECSRVEPSGVTLPERGAACTAPPSDRLLLRWPAPDALTRTLVRLPFTYLGGEILLRVKLGGRDVHAFLDSGAGATGLDAMMPAGMNFRPSMEMSAPGSTQKTRVGFGELPALDLGDLHAEHVPAISVPIPGQEVFGDKRPELLLGYAFFASAVIRVDYRRLEVVIAKSADGLFAKAHEPRAVPLRVLKSKIIVDGAVEGIPAPFSIDTGHGGGVDLYKGWASAHDLPGKRPVAFIKGRFGAGGNETAIYRLATASLGPIAFDGHLSHVVDPPGSGFVAGLAGNEVLARCDAVVFDVPKRTLWLEGPCDRPVPERRVGWRFEKKVDPAQPDRPWVVSALWQGGPAHRAGIRVGDRVLEMGGKPATADVGPLWALEQQPAGTKLPVVVSRAGKAPQTKERVVIELRSLAPP